MKNIAKLATCFAATLMMGCAKNVDWGYNNNAYETVTIGYDDAFVNITAPGSVANIVLSSGNNVKQYGYDVNGENLLAVPYASAFVSQANRQPVSPSQTTTNFYADNKNSVFEFKNDRDRKKYRFEPNANALVRFKGNNLKADSLNSKVMSRILHNSQWRNQ